MGNMLMNSLYRLMGKKRKNNGAMWISLFSVGIGAAILGVLTGKRKMPNTPMKSMVNNFTPNNFAPKSDINMMDNAALAEFSEELLSKALNERNETSSTTASNERNETSSTNNTRFANNHDTPNNNQY